MSFLKKNWFVSVTLGLFLISLPIILFEVQRQQTLRSRAAGDGSILINDGALTTVSQTVVLALTAPWPGQSGAPISVPGSLPIGSRIFSSRALSAIIKPVKAQGSYSCEISTWTVDSGGKDGCSQNQYCVQFSVRYSGDVAYPVQQRWPWGWNNSNQDTFQGYNFGSGSQTIGLTAVDGDGKRLTSTCGKTIDVPGSNTPTVSTVTAQTQTQQTQTSSSQSQTSAGSCTIYTDLVDPNNQNLLQDLSQKSKSNYLDGCKGRDFCVRYTLQTDSLSDNSYVQWNFGNGVDFNSLSDARAGYTFRPYDSSCSAPYTPSAKVFNKDGQEVASCSKDKEPVSLCKTVSEAVVAPATPTPTLLPTGGKGPGAASEEPGQTQPSESPTPVPAPRFTKEFRVGNTENELITKPWLVWIGDSMSTLHGLTSGAGQKTVYAQFRSVDNVASKVISASILYQPPVQTTTGSVSIRPPSCPTGYFWDGSKCATTGGTPSGGYTPPSYTYSPPPPYVSPPPPTSSQQSALLVGDINQDGEVDELDRELLIWSWSASGLESQVQGADLNGDGRVNTVDLAIIDQKIKESK